MCVCKHFDKDERVCAAVVLDDVDGGIKVENLFERGGEGLLVKPVGMLANAVYQSSVHICASQHKKVMPAQVLTQNMG